MNKRYIDFVPPKKGVAEVSSEAKTEKPVKAGPKSISVADENELGEITVKTTKTAARKPAQRTGGRTMDSFTMKKSAKKPVVKPVAKPVVKPAVKPVVKPVEEPEDNFDDDLELGLIFGEKEVEAPEEPITKPAPRSNRPVARSAASAKFGVIEDLDPHFVKTEVEKRPLSQNKAQFMSPRKQRMAASREMARRPVDRLAERPEGKWDDEPAPQIAKKVIDWPKGKPVNDYSNEAPMNLPVSRKSESVDDVDKMLDEALFEAENVGKRGKKAGRSVRPTPFVRTEVEKRPLSKSANVKKVVVPEEEPSGPVTIIHKPERDSRVGLIVAIIITIILGATAGTVAFLLLPK